MLINPFTPSEIASSPEDFFGREQELRTVKRSITTGSLAIQGPIGIGKSSLLARARLLLEGFDSSYKCTSVIAVGDKDIQTIDQAARLLLESFVEVDEKQNKVKFSLGSVFEAEWAEICKFFAEGRHLAALKRIVEKESLNKLVANDEYLILAIDEADKCPAPLARLIRSIVTHTQQQGVKRVRFIVSGVRPYFQLMVDEDPGINRFIYRTITLGNMTLDEATELIETKLTVVAENAEEQGIDLTIDPDVIDRVVALSGGHPHILQLLGSHLVEHENDDPDGIIDSRDLMSSLRRVCYEDRARVYDSTIHFLELHGRLDALILLLSSIPVGFPTRIDRYQARRFLDTESLDWLMKHNILSAHSSEYYGLVDEFLRIRLLLDRPEPTEVVNIERLIIEEESIFQDNEMDPRFINDDENTEYEIDKALELYGESTVLEGHVIDDEEDEES
jgi:hypothetical protein